jgi:hypothetical protein
LATPIIPRGTAALHSRAKQQRVAERGLTLLGVDLQDAREEIFVRMVCDGIALGVAYARAGFKGKSVAAASALFKLPRIQERANAILEARRTTGVVTLSEVTDMLQRVYAGAHAAEEYSAAHNAAFSLARLYGHVTDRSTLEVIRRPSRDPDAPSEQVLSDWVASLPVVSPEPAAPLEGPFRSAPAAPLGPGPQTRDGDAPNDAPHPVLSADNMGPEGPGPQVDLSNDINDLAGEGPGGTENGAPTRPVTGTPNKRGRSELLGPDPRAGSELLGSVAQLDVGRASGSSEAGSPFADEGTTAPAGGDYPSAEELFG